MISKCQKYEISRVGSLSEKQLKNVF